MFEFIGKKFLTRNKFLPIVLPGGIGDTIMGVEICERIHTDWNIPVVVYSNYPEVFSIFSKLPSYHCKKFKRFEFFLKINSTVEFMLDKKFTQFPLEILEDKFLYLSQVMQKKNWKQLIKYHPYSDNNLASQAVALGLNRRTLPFYFLGMEPSSRKYKFLKHKPSQKYITLHDGYENLPYLKGRVTKTWDMDHWEKFVKIFKEKMPDVKVYQIGSDKSRTIRGTDASVIGKLSFIGSLRLIEGALWHVDGDSGMSHAATAVQTPTVVLFGPTNMKFFQYDQNKNINSPFCTNCWWLTTDWMANCPRGFLTPKCMDAITPEQVLATMLER